MKDFRFLIESSIHSIDAIPTLPDVVTRISREIQNPRTTADQIGKIISNDQSLSLTILKLVNSAFYGFPRRINTISHAVAILGFNTIKNLVLTTSLLTTLKSDVDSPLFNQKQFWMHSLAVGTFAKVIAEEIKFRQVEEVFLAGIIHDIGKIILLTHFTAEFESALSKAASEKLLLIEAEHSIFGFNHTEIGFWLAEKWQLPPFLSHVILNHHTPEKSIDYHTICCIVQLSDVLVRALSIGFAGDAFNQTLTESNWDSLAIPFSAIPKLLEKAESELSKTSILMQLV